MLLGKTVRIRFRKDQANDPTWVFVGEVSHFDEAWIAVKGKGILVYRKQTLATQERVLKVREPMADKAMGVMESYQVDNEIREMVFPRDTVKNIRTLPDDFDLASIRLVESGRRINIVVDGAPDTSVDEMTHD